MITSSSSLAWRRSNRCDTSACVEVAVAGDGMALRDSKHVQGPILRVSRDEWNAFTNGLRAGAFGDR